MLTGNPRDLNLAMLPHRLKVVRIDRVLHQSAYALLDMFFTNPRSFVSMTITEGEVSLVIDERDLAEFPEDIMVSPSTFKAFEVTSSETDLVHRLSEPLANAGVSIFYLSTFETNYVLIPEPDIKTAFKALTECFNFSIDDTELTEFKKSLGHEGPCLCGSSPSSGTKRAVSNLCVYPNLHLSLVSMRLQIGRLLGVSVLKYIFNKKVRSTFFSLTLMEDRLSLVVPQDEIESITEDATDDIRDEMSIHSDKFIPLAVDEHPLGFDDWGIVNSIATPMSKNNVHIFYVSTYNTDYTLIPEVELETALSTLRFSQFHIREQSD